MKFGLVLIFSILCSLLYSEDEGVYKFMYYVYPPQDSTCIVREYINFNSIYCDKSDGSDTSKYLSVFNHSQYITTSDVIRVPLATLSPLKQVFQVGEFIDLNVTITNEFQGLTIYSSSEPHSVLMTRYMNYTSFLYTNKVGIDYLYYGHVDASIATMATPAVVEWIKSECVIKINSPSSIPYLDYALIHTKVLRSHDWKPIIPDMLYFTIESRLVYPVCDAHNDGYDCHILAYLEPGTYQLEISFNGSSTSESCRATTMLEIAKKKTMINFYNQEQILAVNGGSLTLSPQLNIDHLHLGGARLNISIGESSCTGITNEYGIMTCVFNNISLPLGGDQIVARFDGNSYYLPAEVTLPIVPYFNTDIYSLTYRRVPIGEVWRLIMWCSHLCNVSESRPKCSLCTTIGL